MGWFSQIEQPFVRDVSIAVWRLFSDLDLSEAKKTQFVACMSVSSGNSRMEPGHRNGSCGACQPMRRYRRRVRHDQGTELMQIKDFPTVCRICLAIRIS